LFFAKNPNSTFNGVNQCHKKSPPNKPPSTPPQPRQPKPALAVMPFMLLMKQACQPVTLLSKIALSM